MIELPRIAVSFVDEYRLPKRGAYAFSNFPRRSAGTEGHYRFQADAGLETRIGSSCRSYGLSLALRYEGLKPAEMGNLLLFLDAVELDTDSGLSLKTFSIPKNHPLWEKVSVWQYLERIAIADNLDDAHWIITDPGTVSVPICNVHKMSFRVEEVFS